MPSVFQDIGASRSVSAAVGTQHAQGSTRDAHGRRALASEASSLHSQNVLPRSTVTMPGDASLSGVWKRSGHLVPVPETSLPQIEGGPTMGLNCQTHLSFSDTFLFFCLFASRVRTARTGEYF